LNAIEKLNCVYCGYANGVLAYAREIAGRTEQYWCPLRHALRVRGPHAQYRDFVEYGDAAGYRARLEELRARLR
jgi:N-glycosylase/DNA lyase